MGAPIGQESTSTRNPQRMRELNTSEFSKLPNTGHGLASWLELDHLEHESNEPYELDTTEPDYKAKKRRSVISDESVNANGVPNPPNDGIDSRNPATGPSHAVIINERKPERSDVEHEHAKREEKLNKFFRECAPTEERLELLGRRWLSRNFLQGLLLYCRPFTISIQDPEAPTKPKFLSFWPQRNQPRPTKKLVTIDHHDLFEYLHHDDNWDCFATQVSEAWPTSFGSLVEEEGNSPSFLWQAREPYGGTGTSYICRKSASSGSQPLLEALFYGYSVYFQPDYDMSW